MINIRNKLFARKKRQSAHANTKNFIIYLKIESAENQKNNIIITTVTLRLTLMISKRHGKGYNLLLI